MRFLPCGDAAVLVEVGAGDVPGAPDALHAVLALHAALVATPPTGVIDLVPAAQTLLLHLDPAATTAAAVVAAVRTTRPLPTAPQLRPPVEIAVSYDGADLAEVGRLTGLGKDGVIRAHAGQPWVAAFGGFVPGFAYLLGADDRLQVPRRATPRVRVPAGAVGLAGRFCGIYPRASPGGWQLIGRTQADLWNLDRDPPALLPPGTTVRFVESGR